VVLDKKQKTVPVAQGQLYRVYSGQVALCVNTGKMKGYQIPRADQQPDKTAAPATLPRGHTAHPAVAPKATVAKSAITNTGMNIIALNSPTSLTSFSLSSGGSPPAAGGAPKSASSGVASSSGSSGGSAGQATTAALQAQRFSAMVDDDGCGSGEIVLDESSEVIFQNTVSAGFVHIQWRSISEVFEYLGATLRYQANLEHTPKSIAGHIDGTSAISWAEPPTSWVAMGDQDADAVKEQSKADATDPCSVQPGVCEQHILFSLSDDPNCGLSTSYNDNYYTICESRGAIRDETMSVLSMLNTLVDVANTSSGATPTAPIQLLPIP
jgi:hypothetical protein